MWTRLRLLPCLALAWGCASRGTVGSTGEGTIGMSPPAPPGVVLQLDAAVGVKLLPSGRVESWADGSPFAHVAQAMGAGPSLVRLASGGHPALQFALVDGQKSWLKIADHPSLQWGTGDLAIWAVVRYRNAAGPEGYPTGYAVLLGKQGGNACLGPALFLNDHFALGKTGAGRSGAVFQTRCHFDFKASSERTGLNDDAVHVVVAVRRGRVLQLRIDGAPAGAAVAAMLDDVSNPGIDVNVGAHPSDLGQQLEGELFELIVARGLPDAEVAERERSLLEKYAVGKPAPAVRADGSARR